MQTPEEKIQRWNQRSNLSNFLSTTSTMTLGFLKIPYEIPAFVPCLVEMYRRVRYGKSESEVQNDVKKKELVDMLNEDAKKAASLGMMAGIGLGAILDVAQVGAYSYLAFNGHPESLLIPTATNLLSGISECWKWNSRRKQIRKLRNQLENTITFGVNYRMKITIPSSGQQSLIAISYTLTNPSTIKVETGWSQKEALRPEYEGEKFVEFNEGELYLNQVFSDEVVSILEQRFTGDKYKEIRRNFRRPSK